MSKKEGNCNVMRLHDQSRDRSNLIGTISYHNSSRGWPLINYLSLDLPNFLDQPFDNQFFKSTYTINLFIELAALLACDTLVS